MDTWRPEADVFADMPERYKRDLLRMAEEAMPLYAEVLAAYDEEA